MSYKLFIDDERFPIKDDWMIARTSEEAVQTVLDKGFPSEISFDHDLGGDDTAIWFILWLYNEVPAGNVKIPSYFKYSIHSQNPIGVANIKSKMDQLLKFYQS